MSKNVVIVESPAKANTIEKYLGEDFLVTSSYGHIRDLIKKDKGIDVENNYTPHYIIPEDKKARVKELKKLSDKSETVWLATDEDREGEAIAWHLKEVLELPEKKIRRIVFSEITKPAILDAVKNPRGIDYNLVNSQQSRRILDRLVGFELSPILWRKVKPKLSAGRVQSVAVRLIVEREREIDSFKSESRYKVTGNFLVTGKDGKKSEFKAEVPDYFESSKEAKDFLESCKTSEFLVESIEKKPAKKSPSPPFTTSTLQQEASRKLRFSVSRTMLVAQKLYEAGKITYMRTDSVNLSEIALNAAEQQIKNEYGKNYSHRRQFKTKSKTAQEAHEAIRPTDFGNESISGSRDEKVLYELIWKRALASQMSDAQLERTTLKINVSKADKLFVAKGEVIKFDGFLKVYLESIDDENGENGEDGILPDLSEGEKISFTEITATQRFTRPPSRFTEASLVKKLEELGIGRPSTYAPTISTIQKRGYVHKEEREGTERKYEVLTLDQSKKIKSETLTEITGADKGKLFPNDVAMLVNDFLLEHFPQVMDYKFTARIEEELDEIANGEMDYHEMLDEFYPPFKKKVEHTIETSERVSGERILGKDPATGKQVSVRMARFGPVAVLSNPKDENDKPHYAGLRKTQKLENLTLEEALHLFKLPRLVGKYNDQEVIAAIGRFGPYVRFDGKFYSIKAQYDPHDIEIDEAIEVIEAKKKADAEKTIKIFEENPEFQILKGRWGPYLKAGKENVKIPKDREPASLTYDECVKLAEEAKLKPKRKGRFSKSKT
ncbi:MAG: type I DNA topoisomerase [Ignavibacteriota bacterium]|nr:MAG: type I DNA topoisomerase [Chlorobiota bacterium]MBE7475292.1 type I DNA topoisomerase [Ignavibacteriales bacterium]MBL1122259.1 type I DNA topoisomerase [Ignavibacteriota bacterium]MCC7093801.1 type I DNA topoisomerase [Ignavibacteriaceae bacterium]MCE7855414.1 type I DNA topoisomerase [Ignavibacteria bacterium CHB3]MEB2296557.1 type I DNA topoisomerase [Ignavibacteria bacterium]